MRMAELYGPIPPQLQESGKRAQKSDPAEDGIMDDGPDWAELFAVLGLPYPPVQPERPLPAVRRAVGLLKGA